MTPSCGSTPGIEEPVVTVCFVVDVDELECVNSATEEVTKREITSLDDLVGVYIVEPRDYAAINNHHDALHVELNQCKEE